IGAVTSGNITIENATFSDTLGVDDDEGVGLGALSIHKVAINSTTFNSGIDRYVADYTPHDNDLQQVIDSNTFTAGDVAVTPVSGGRRAIVDLDHAGAVVNLDQRRGFSTLQAAVDEAQSGETLQATD